MYDIFFKLFYRNICHLWHNLHRWDFNKRTKHGSLNPGRFLNNKPYLNQLHICSACLFKKLIPDYLFWMHSFVENNIRRWKKNWQDICNCLFSNHFGTFQTIYSVAKISSTILPLLNIKCLFGKNNPVLCVSFWKRINLPLKLGKILKFIYLVF